MAAEPEKHWALCRPNEWAGGEGEGGGVPARPAGADAVPEPHQRRAPAGKDCPDASLPLAMLPQHLPWQSRTWPQKSTMHRHRLN